MIRLLRALIPPPIRGLARRALETPSRLAFRHRLRPFTPPQGQPVLSFGRALPPRGIVFGGQVKLLTLRDAFLENDEVFSTLYLVSSAPPPHAGELVRWAKKQGARFVWNQNGVGYPGWAGRDYKLLNAPMAALLHQADHVIYQSQFCRDSADHFLGPANIPATILFNPVDLTHFTPASLAPEPLRLLTIGNHAYPDRVLSTLRALAILREKNRTARLTIAGQLLWPAGEQDLADAIRQLGLDGAIDRHGPFTQAEAPAIYRAHHILLHAKYLDPCPTVVIEALACGLPVVGSATGGLAEMIAPDAGVLLPLETRWDRLLTPEPADLADAVATLAARLPEASAAARHCAEIRFDQKTWIARHAAIFSR